MKDLPKISVLLAVHNGEKHIERSILSVLDQTYANFELIICANGCTDDTIPVIGKIINDPLTKGKIHFTALPIYNKSGALNWILHLATGDFVAINDSEIWMPDKLKEEILKADKHLNNGGLIRHVEAKRSGIAKVFDAFPIYLDAIC